MMASAERTVAAVSRTVHDSYLPSRNTSSDASETVWLREVDAVKWRVRERSTDQESMWDEQVGISRQLETSIAHAAGRTWSLFT